MCCRGKCWFFFVGFSYEEVNCWVVSIKDSRKLYAIVQFNLDSLWRRRARQNSSSSKNSERC